MAKGEASLVLKIKTTGAKALGTVPKLLRGVGKAAIGAAGAVAAYAGAVAAFASKAASFDEIAMSFKNLALSQGQDADKMLAKMRDLSKGTVSDLELMKNANQALLLGLPVDRFGDMLEIARSSAKATGQSMQFMLESITLGLGRGSRMILDNLGILVNTNKAYETYAKTLGTTADKLDDAQKKQAFINEALRIGKENAKKLSSETLSLTDRLAQLKADSENASISLGQKLAPALSFLIKKATSATNEMKKFAASSTATALFSGLTKGAAMVMTAFNDMGAVVGGILGGIVLAITDIAEGKFSRALERVKNTGKFIEEEIAENHKQFRADMAEIDAEFDAAETAREGTKVTVKQLAEAKKQKAVNDRIKKDLAAEDKAIASAKAARAAADKDLLNLGIQTDSKKLNAMTGTFGRIQGLTQSNNKTLQGLGRAAASASIVVDTAKGIGKAIGAFPPPVNFVMAGLVAAAGATQLAAVNSSPKLAEGGIISARPGGMSAIIGEGGRDEAVVPLDDIGGGGIGGNVTINVQGGMLGDPESAREFAIAVDEQLFQLRKDNSSIAFDERAV